MGSFGPPQHPSRKGQSAANERQRRGSGESDARRMGEQAPLEGGHLNTVRGVIAASIFSSQPDSFARSGPPLRDPFLLLTVASHLRCSCPLPATPEVNRFWRRLIWDDELKRLYSHLDGVTHSIDSHQKPLYLENTFHDQARDRSTQIYADRIARENIGLFKRLMAVHTRKPREFLTHHVQNPKTHSRFLEYQRVQEDNHRLVERLLSARTFLNDRGSLDEHALAHEQLLLRLSHNPKNCFVPDLHVKRKQDQKRMREESIALQALKKIQSKPLSTHAQTQAQLERVQRELDASGIHVHKSWLGDPQAPTIRSPKYSYPLPPGSPMETNGQMELKPHPTVLLPYGTHLVAPALVDQGQYDSLTRSLAGLDTTHQSVQPVSPPKGARTYAASGEMEDANLTLTMPPPSTIEFGGMTNGVFYLRPHSLGSGSSNAQQRAESRSRDASPSKAVLASDSIEYPFRFPPLEGRDGVRLGQQQQWQQHQQQVLEEGSEQSEEKQQSQTDEYGQQQQYHRRARSSGMAQPQMMHPDDMYDGRASTAQPSSRSHHLDPSSTAHPQPQPPPMAPSHSQAFLDFFGGTQGGPISLRSPRGAPAGPSQLQGRRGKGLSTGRGKSSHAPPQGASTALPPLSLSSMTSRSHRFHHDYPSVFTHAQSTSVAHASVAGPRKSKSSRRSQQEKLEQLLDETILAAERQQREEEDQEEEQQQQQQRQQMAATKLQPRPPGTQKKQEESKEPEQPKTAAQS
jgi:hypothetical protein